MRSLASVLAGLTVCGAAAAQPAPVLQPPAQTVPYSFADVYRLTVGGPIVGLPLAEGDNEATIRVAALEAPALEPRFTVRPVPQPGKWLMILAGLALAGWVAHRRLAYL